jgi:hypothetical protein
MLARGAVWEDHAQDASLSRGPTLVPPIDHPGSVYIMGLTCAPGTDLVPTLADASPSGHDVRQNHPKITNRINLRNGKSPGHRDDDRGSGAVRRQGLEPRTR